MNQLLPRWAAPLAALCLMAGLLVGYRLQSAAPALIAAALAMLCALLHRGQARSVSLLAAVLALGAVLGFAAQHPVLPEEGEYTVTAVVSDTVRQRETDTQVHTLLHHVILNGQPFHRSAYWSFYTDALPEGLTPGARVSFTGRLYHPEGAENPGGYDFRLSLLQKGVTIGLYGMDDLQIGGPGGFCLLGSMADWREQLSGALCRMLGEESGAYASAMLLGERALLPEEDVIAFRSLGMAHVLSVSGYHVGVLAALLMALLGLLHVALRHQVWPVGAVLTFYCLLTGLHPPVIRASILVLLGLYGRRNGAVPLRLHWLSASAILQLVVSPIQLLSASFQLTYCALLGVILVNGFFTRQIRRLPWKPGWARVFAAALGAQLGILLPELYWFHELPALGLLTNVLLLGVVSFLMSMYWLCLPLLMIPGVSAAYGALVAGATSLFSAFLRWSSSVAGFMIWTRQANLFTAIGWFAVLAAVNPLWPRWGRRQLMATAAGLIVVVLSVLPWPHTGTTYTQLSVGDADAAVLQDDSVVMVIDTGESSALASYLHAHRMSVDTLILTHLHADHTAGIATLLDQGIPVRRCILPAGALDQPLHESIPPLLDALAHRGTVFEDVSRGDVIPLPNGQLTVLWPEAGRVRADQSANDYSMVLLARLYDTTLLLTGDLTGTYERYAAVPADVLKAAHHGSSTSTGPAFLEIVQPKVILQSCGSDARAEGLQGRVGGVPVYATQRHGAITLTIDRDGCTIQPYLP